MRSIGTCFAVTNDGLCMTAKHLIDEIPYDADGIIVGNLGALYLDPTKEIDTSDLFGGFIPMHRMHCNASIDIALMHLNLPMNTDTGERLPLPANRLALELPNVDDRLIAFGYEEGEWQLDEDGGRTLSQTFTASTGFVANLHPTGRDRVILPTPCFQTSASFRSGMSGGPVINENGFVVGVISTGFEMTEGEEPISYATPVAPAMGISLPGIDANGTESILFLWDFVEGGALLVERGSAKVSRTDHELVVALNCVSYRAELGS